MVTATTCPSINDCNNPAELPKNQWSLVYVDSQEVNYPGLATMSFDGDPETIWHTRWSTGDDPYPHEIQVDMGETYRIYSFTYLTRQDGENGRIKNYELYISDDLADWGTPVSVGQFENTAAPQTIELEQSVTGRYFRLLALSEVNGNLWASAAEFSVVGCTDLTFGIPDEKNLHNVAAFPVPTAGLIRISVPGNETYKYSIVSQMGQIVGSGVCKSSGDGCVIDVQGLNAGTYTVRLVDNGGKIYRVKVIKY